MPALAVGFTGGKKTLISDCIDPVLRFASPPKVAKPIVVPIIVPVESQHPVWSRGDERFKNEHMHLNPSPLSILIEHYGMSIRFPVNVLT